MHALQGERAMARDNKSLGRFELTGIPPAPRGIPQIEVSFEIDADGILQVAAKDKGTGRAQSIRITNTGGLTSSEIDKMREEAEAYADDDAMRKVVAEMRNKADTLFYSYESTMRENAEWISDERKAHAQESETALREALNNKDITPEALQEALDALQQTIFAIGAEMYRQVNPDDNYDIAMDETTPDMQPESSSHEEVTSEEPVAAAATPDAIDLLADEPEFDFDATITADYEAIE